MLKTIWVGGVHGVGKTSSLEMTVDKNDSLEYLYLGKLFYETANYMGYKWNNLSERSNLLKVEEKVADKLEKEIQEKDLIIDCHFAIHFGGKITYPGFHSYNLKRLFLKKESKIGIIYLFANPEIILQRRKQSKKEFKSYITKEDLNIVNKELLDSQNYFNYFVNSFDSNLISE